MIRCLTLSNPPLSPPFSSLTENSRKMSVTVCVYQRSEIPKLESFSRSRIDRGLKEPSFLQKSENAIADYCSTVDGDESYGCWRAYFELKELEAETPREQVESLIRQTDGVKSLISLLHAVASMIKKTKEKVLEKPPPSEQQLTERPFPVPDGLPKTKEELEEEERALMPDSPFTRLLRSKGRSPAWYSHLPDHETD
ncbi:hypothetical protein AMTRI_Chr13g91780 [Amborella trichopoda]|uniref:Uncharacterized protein n=1 Tax=Amborella trichopoda TaxID=13333 RepID=U5D636_AMBTC|nr:CCG-binding protein 1 [Amborella trichopoda]ERN17700.1 hypothetical protein AMTR_s00059p00211060 [Amborella trichopoda]|eukprot:XP_006856233.1 CCG-binding protein 1 [Amborella trichopoda]